MPVLNSMAGVSADAQSVVSFFSQTCAPGTNSNGPRQGGQAWNSLCTACKVGGWDPSGQKATAGLQGGVALLGIRSAPLARWVGGSPGVKSLLGCRAARHTPARGLAEQNWRAYLQHRAGANYPSFVIWPSSDLSPGHHLMQGDCSADDPYADYPGTLRCVMEGAGDVAFTKHNIALEYSRDGTTPQPWSTLNRVRSWAAGVAGCLQQLQLCPSSAVLRALYAGMRCCGRSRAEASCAAPLACS